MLVGNNYTLEFSDAFSGIDGNEVILESISSLRTLLDYNIDVYSEVFEPVGLDRAAYQRWADDVPTLYAFRRGDVIYRVPHGYFVETDPIETVDFRQGALVVELPYLTAEETESVRGLVPIIKELCLVKHGLDVMVEYTPYGKTKPIPLTEANGIHDTRMTRKNEAQDASDDLVTVKAVNADLRVKLEGLEQIIIDQAIRT